MSRPLHPMIILYDQSGLAIVRLCADDWFVSYAEPLHLGWLSNDAVFAQTGDFVGWFADGILRDYGGDVVAVHSGVTRPRMAKEPERPAEPTSFARVPGKPKFLDSWSPHDYKQLFRVEIL